MLVPSMARADCPDAAARVVSVQGTVEAKRVGAADWTAAQVNDVYCPGDTLRVQSKSRADVALTDQSVLRLREGSTLVVQGIKQERGYVVDLLQGAAHVLSRQGAGNLEVNTPFTVAGVRGTEFAVDVETDKAVVRVFEGRVLASNGAGGVSLGDGQAAVAEPGKAPVLRVEARPRDAVRWTLYYPPVIYVAPGEPGREGGWRGALVRSV